MKNKVDKVVEFAEQLGLDIVLTEYDNMYILDILKDNEDRDNDDDEVDFDEEE